MSEELLRQTLAATEGLFNAPSDDPGALAAYALSGVHAWSAHRFLTALMKADPDLAADTAADLAEQLDSGEIGEWAWDAAVEAGHDPQQWADARAQARAEKPRTTNTAAARPLSPDEQEIRNPAMQALSNAGAVCGNCGDEPGDRTCPDCERIYRTYLSALRDAGWAPRTETLHQAATDLSSACPDHSDADEAWMDCPCEYADELRRMAKTAEQGEQE